MVQNDTFTKCYNTLKIGSQAVLELQSSIFWIPIKA